MPYIRGSGYGDLYVQLNTEVPISLNKEQKELLEKFRQIENEKSNPSIKKFFDKAKNFWKNWKMGFEQIVPAIALIAVLILVLPNFLRSNSEKKQLFKNLSIWGIIVLVVVILSYLIFTWVKLN